MNFKSCNWKAAAVAGLLAAAGFASNASAQCSSYSFTAGTDTIVPGTTDVGSACDDCSVPITIPFAWNFFGADYTTVMADSNGYLYFSTDDFSGAYNEDGECVPAAFMTVPAMFPAWTDGYTAGAGLGIFTSVSGVAPNRIFNIEYRNSYFPGATGSANYEVRLYEGQTKFDFVYGAVTAENWSSSIGCQAGTQSTSVQCGAPLPAAGTRYTFDLPAVTPPCVTLTTSPVSSLNGATISAFAHAISGTGPSSPINSVRLDASSIGAGASIVLHDDGVAPDVTAGDHTYSGSVTVAAAPGAYTLTTTATDGLSRVATATATFTVLVPPPPGDECSNPLTAVLGNNAFDSTSEGVTTSPQVQGCGAIGSDLWYTFTTTAAGNYIVSTCGGTTADTAIQVYRDCNTWIACNDDSCGVESNVGICDAPANTTYLIRMGGFGGARWAGTFSIAYATPTAAPYAQPAVTVAETEPCATFPDNSNGGCNSIPEIFANGVFCTDYSGTSANGFNDPATGYNRDTDWYQFTVAAADTMTIHGQAQFDAYCFLISAPCPGTVVNVVGNDVTTCVNNDFDMTAAVAPGTYYIAILPKSFYGDVTCGFNEKYWFHATLASTVCSHCGSADFNCDGDIGTDSDIAGFFSCLSGSCPSLPCTNSADFNGDGDIGTDGDIEAFFRVLGGGHC